MRKSLVALGLLGSVVVVGAVLARPSFTAKTVHAPEVPQTAVLEDTRQMRVRPLETPAGFRRGDTESRTLHTEAPFKLTASDGTGLVLASLDARAVLEGPLAFTEMRMVFDNPENRVLEGRFQITLPTGASVSRFAMKIGNEWQEGEVVERKRARLAYEDFLHRKQDPALLEQAAGNEFTARVFPIPARGRKEVILSYSTEIKGEYTLPLRGLAADAIDIRATSGTKGQLLGQRHLTADDAKAPGEDFVVHGDPNSAGRASGLRNGNLVIARVFPEVDTAPDALGDTLVLVDTSASRGIDFDEQVGFVSRLITAIATSYGSGTRISVACFDQSVEAVYEGEASGFGEATTTKMKTRGALGASNLAGALAWAKGEALTKKYKRVVLVTDGVATAGASAPDALKDAVLELGKSGVERLDAIAEGGIRDDAALKSLVTAGLARDGVVVESTAAFSTIGRKLTSRTRSAIAVNVEGASWVYPSRLEGVQAGDEILVYAEVPEGTTPSVSLGYPKAGGVTVEKVAVEFASAERPLVERAWAKAKITALSEKLADAKEPADVKDVEHEIIAISTKTRVLSPYTSLLVLETEQDFRRFDIDRKALSGILTVENGRLATVSRSWEPRKNTNGNKAAESPQREETAANHGAPPPAGPTVPMVPMQARTGAAADLKQKDDDGASAPAMKSAATPAAAADDAQESTEKSSDHAFSQPQMGGLAAATTPAPVAAAAAAPPSAAARRARPRVDIDSALLENESQDRGDNRPHGAAPYTGTFKTVMDFIAAGRKAAAVDAAGKWHTKDPGDVMALVAMGEAWEATGEVDQAARAYGSIIDLFSSRADLRRFAGERLERLKADSAIALAVDTYEKAAEDRPDHPSSHRLLAWAHVRNKAYDKAFGVLEKSLRRQYPRFDSADRILREDLGIVAKAWAASDPSMLDEIKNRLRNAHASLDSGPSLRFVLNWETDANDVDFHIFDSHGGHAYFQQQELPSGGDLYADITTGYGPECFAIRKGKWERDAQYTLQAHYYSRGPMGYGMGKLQIIEHDGKGGLHVEDRPFVVMADEAFVNLGVVRR